MRLIIKITKQEAIDAWKKQNKHISEGKDTIVEFEDVNILFEDVNILTGTGTGTDTFTYQNPYVNTLC